MGNGQNLVLIVAHFKKKRTILPVREIDSKLNMGKLDILTLSKITLIRGKIKIEKYFWQMIIEI